MKKLHGKVLFNPPRYLEVNNKFSKKSDFEFTRKLGDGSYSQVWRVKHKRSSNLYAIKQVQKSKVNFILHQFFREVEILYKVSHPHIIKIFSHFEDDKYFYLVMELMEGGTLFHKLYREKCFSEGLAAQYFREIVCAVEFLHTMSPGIVHRDIKPENVMLDKDQRVRLIDFGWSNYLEDCEQRKTYCGTAEYMPPEMINKTGHGLGIDIWCLGILLHEMLVGYTPFRSNDRNTLNKLITCAKFKLPEQISVPAQVLIKQMLEPDNHNRISIYQVKSSMWLQSIPPLRKIIELARSAVEKSKINLGCDFKIQTTNSSESEEETLRFDWRSGVKKLKEKIEVAGKESAGIKRRISDVEKSLLEKDERINDLEETVFKKKREILRVSGSIKKMLSRGFDYNLELEILQGNHTNELLEKRNEIENKLHELSKKCKCKRILLESLRKDVNRESVFHSNLETQLQRLRSSNSQLQKVNYKDRSGKKSSENELKLQIDILKYQLAQQHLISTNFSPSELVVAKEISGLILSKLNNLRNFVPEVETRLEKIEEKLYDTEQIIYELNFSYNLSRCLIMNKYQIEKVRILQEKNNLRNSLRADGSIKQDKVSELDSECEVFIDIKRATERLKVIIT